MAVDDCTYRHHNSQKLQGYVPLDNIMFAFLFYLRFFFFFFLLSFFFFFIFCFFLLLLLAMMCIILKYHVQFIPETCRIEFSMLDHLQECFVQLGIPKIGIPLKSSKYPFYCWIFHQQKNHPVWGTSIFRKAPIALSRRIICTALSSVGGLRRQHLEADRLCGRP